MYFLLLYIFFLSALFQFLKKIGKNVEYKYIYGLYKIENRLDFLEKISKSKLIKIFEYAAIPIGFISMIVAIYFIFYGIKARIPTVVPVIPGLEIYGIKFPIFEVILAIFISALVHELAHALLIIKNKIEIKSFGIFFFGPFLGAFVEPSEDIFKLNKIKQISIFNAGILANILLSLFVALLIYILYSSNILSSESYVYIVGKVPNVTNVENLSFETNEKVLFIGNKEIRGYKDIVEALSNYSPGDKIELITDKGKYIIELSERDGKPFIGLYFAQEVKFGMVFNILFWIFIISLGIGLGNSLPIFTLDGGQALKALLNILIKDDKKASKLHILVSYLILAALIINFTLLFGK
ncbi:MAG: site-2 protease family protein [Candidatus Aenigmatarchaeota archaeon]